MHRYRLEVLLILAVALLVGQLVWPAVNCWWSRPGPGAIGIDTYAPIDAMAPKYAVYLPKEYGDDANGWPLIVFLHGSGERGSDPAILRGRGPMATVQNEAKLPAIVVAPQCLPNRSWQPDAVVHFIEHVASTYHVDRERIYLVGYSMGGFGAWATAAAYPDLFAAIVPICGGGAPDKAKALADVPVWAFHGAKDDAVPLARSEEIIEAMRRAGGNPKLTVIPDAGHGICESTCQRNDLWNWLLNQQRPGTGQR